MSRTNSYAIRLRVAVCIATASLCVSVHAATASTCKWISTGDRNWSNANNWSCDDGGVDMHRRPGNGDSLLFDNEATQPSPVNDIENLTVTDIRINGRGVPPVASHWFITGTKSLTIDGDLKVNAPVANGEGPAFLVPIIPGQNLNIVNNGEATLQIGNISTGNTGIVFSNSTGIDVVGQISGTGSAPSFIVIKKDGDGVLTLHDNTYTGAMLMAGGTLIATSSTSLGAGGVNNIVVVASGVLSLADGVTIAQSVQIHNDGQITVPADAAATVMGEVLPLGNTGTLVPAGTLTIAGRIDPPVIDPAVHVTWNQSGGGTVILSNPQNAWENWRVLSGTLRVGAQGAIPANGMLTLSIDPNPQPATLDLNSVDTTIRTVVGSTGGRVTLGPNTLTVNTANGDDAFFLGTIAGTGNLVKDGPGTFTLAGAQANTYSGTTMVKAGNFQLDRTSTNGTIVGPLVISGGNVLVLESDQIADNAPVTVNRSAQLIFSDTKAVTETIGSLAGDGGFVLCKQGTLSIGANNTSTTFSGLVLGSAAPAGLPADAHKRVMKVGSGTLTMRNGLKPVDQVVVAGGTLIVDGDIRASGVTVLPGATFGGVARLLDQNSNAITLAAAGGAISPGDSLGAIQVGNASFTQGGSFVVELNGTTAGADYDQLDLTGNLTLAADTQLVASLGFRPPAGSTYTIVNLSGNGTVTGTFAGLPEGATLTIGDEQFRITYHGGDGNDVVLNRLGASAPITYYLSEGATGSFFDEDVLIANPNQSDAPVTLTFSKEDGSQVVDTRTVSAQSRMTVHVDQITGLESVSGVSAQVTSTSGFPLVVERSMFWDASRASPYAGSTGSSVDAPTADWFFAEGSQGFFHTFVLINNPNATPTDVTFTFFRESQPPVVKTITVGATTRLTLDCGTVPEIVNASFGIAVHATQPIMAERSIYFDGRGNGQLGGTESSGVTSTSTHWFLAEGATGGFFNTFILVSNPNNTPANVTFQYLLDTGDTVTVAKTIAANARLTTNIAGEDDARLHNAAVSTVVTSDVPVIAERSMYWPGPPDPLREGHNSFGVTDAGLKWGLAEGRTGTPFNYHTYILLANPQLEAANVKATFLREGGAAPIVKTFTVEPTSRFNIDSASDDLAALHDETFGVVIEVTNNVPIIVERSMYWDANGVSFSGGTNATGIRLP